MPALLDFLPAPTFGNTLAMEPQRVVATTRGSTTHVFRDSNWPLVQTLTFVYSKLTQTQVDDLLTFVDANLGVPVHILDQDDVYDELLLTHSSVWEVIITNPENITVSEMGRFCDFSVNLECVGTKL